MTKSLSVRKQVLFSSIIFVVFFLLLELSYRTYQHFTYGIPLFPLLSDVQTNETAVAGATALAVTNPLLHYVLNPNKLSHTKGNFRITGRVESPDYTIVCMGGSSTYGTSVSPAESYPAQLQFFLNQRQHGKTFKVLNAGVPGWSLPHHLSRYIFDLRNRESAIDLVVLYIGHNDMATNIRSGDTLIGHTDSLQTYPASRPFWMTSRFLLWVISRIELATGKNFAPTHLNDFAFRPQPVDRTVNPRNLKRFRDELDLFLNILRNDGVSVLVVLQDTNGHFGSSEKKNTFEVTRQEIRSIAENNRVRVVDMHEVTQSKAEFFTDVIHMSPVGNEKRAKYLTSVILEMTD